MAQPGICVPLSTFGANLVQGARDLEDGQSVAADAKLTRVAD